MGTHETRDASISRRNVLAVSAGLLAGGGIGSSLTALAAAPEAPASAPPLPWKWVKLDPLEAGRRGYRYYKEKGGCGSASYLSLLSLLKEKAGHSWTTMPDMLMVHAAAGFVLVSMIGKFGAYGAVVRDRMSVRGTMPMRLLRFRSPGSHTATAPSRCRYSALSGRRSPESAVLRRAGDDVLAH